MNISSALQDPELGYTSFTVKRITYRRRNGESVPTEQLISAAGSIHPGTPEMVRLLPREEQHEEFISVYTDFALSLGRNNGGTVYSAPDRIIWSPPPSGGGGAAAPEGVWRVVKVRDWSAFGYYQALAVRMQEA